MVAKYKEYVTRMIEAQADLFAEFKTVHDRYGLEQEKLQDKFNEIGAKVMEIVNEWENKLCRQSEKGGYSQFSPKLAEKFRDELRKLFPYIDHIGIQVSYAPILNNEFSLRKINV